MRNHRCHGLFGAVIVEPVAARHYDSICLQAENHGVQAVIAAPGTETFREFVLFAHNGIRLPDAREKGYNYRSERFFNRLGASLHPGDYLYRSGSLRCQCETVCRYLRKWWEKKWYEK